MMTTSLERCWQVINHTIPDRVPVSLHNFLPAAYQTQQKISQVLQNGEFLAEAHMAAWREFGHDILLVENGVVAEAGACGCEVEFFDDGPPRVSRHVLEKSLEKIFALKIPDPVTTFPMSEVIRAVRILSKELGNRVFIMGRADQGPGALAMALRGYEQFLLDLAMMEQEDLLQATLEYCVQVQIRYARALREAGAHGTAMGGLGVSLLSPKLYREWEQPYEKEVIDAVSKPGFPMALHICGNTTAILAEMVETGAPIIEIDHKSDLRIAKMASQGKASILGPVNPELVWSAHQPSEVEDSAKQAIEILAPGGGLILGPGCALGYDTPSANIQALVESARKYGIYNRDGSIRRIK